MYRFQKFARKHQPALVTAAAIALCLLLGTTVSAWQAVRATTAEAQATANETQAKQAASAEAQQRQRAEKNEQAANDQRDEAQRQRDEIKKLNDQLRRTVYASNMTLAKAAWENGDIARLTTILDQYRPKAGETDFRGFEWHYLSRLCHSEKLTIRGYAGNIPGDRSVAFSPDGTSVAFTADDDKIKVVDARTGQERLSLAPSPKFVVIGVAYSRDGTKLACASGLWDKSKKQYRTGEAKIWDATSGKELVTCGRAGGGLNHVVFSPDGKRLGGTTE